MKKEKPAKTKELEWRKAGDTYLLYDKDSNKSFSLDPISFMVWIQCDGKTDIESMVDVFSVNGNRDIVRIAILGIIKKLKALGLIV